MILGRLGAMLGPSSAILDHLGALREHLGTILQHLEAIFGHLKAKIPKMMTVQRFSRFYFKLLATLEAQDPENDDSFTFLMVFTYGS